VRRVAASGVAPALLLTLALTLSSCETTAEKSAKLEKIAQRSTAATQSGLTITHPSAVAKVLSSEIVSGSQGTAVVLTLHNLSAKALGEVPIAVSLKDSKGATVYSNSTPGLARTLTSVALLPPHATLTWIDDQVQATGAATVSAELGEGKPLSVTPAKLSLDEVKLAEGSAEGAIVNGSSATQSELVIYAVARRAGHIVAAGRAVLASVAPGDRSPFQIFFIGDTKGAKLQLDAPPTSAG
jgi:hypothetical protein